MTPQTQDVLIDNVRKAFSECAKFRQALIEIEQIAGADEDLTDWDHKDVYRQLRNASGIARQALWEIPS